MNDDRTTLLASAPTTGAFSVATFGNSPRPVWLDDPRFATWAMHGAGWPRGWKPAKASTPSRLTSRPESLLSSETLHDTLALNEVPGQAINTPVFGWTADNGRVRSLGFGASRLSWDRESGVLQVMVFLNQGWRPADPIHGMDALFEHIMLAAERPDSTFLKAAAFNNDTFQHAPWDWAARMHVVPLREFAMLVPREIGAFELAEHMQAELLGQGLAHALHQRLGWVIAQLRTWRREEPILRRWFAWQRDTSAYDSTWLGRMGWLQRPAVLDAWQRDAGARSRWAHFSATTLMAGNDPNAFSAAYWLRDDNGYQWWVEPHHFQWNSSRTLRWARTASPAVVRALSSKRALLHGVGPDFCWQRLHVMALADLFASAGVTSTPLAAARLVTGLRMETVFLAWTHLNPRWTGEARSSDAFPSLHNARFSTFKTVLETCEKASPTHCEGMYRALVAWLIGARDRSTQWTPGWAGRAAQVWERLSDPLYQASFPWDKVQVTWRWETFQDRVEQGFVDDSDRFWNHDVGYEARPNETVWGSSLGLVTWNGVTVVPVCRESRLQREGERFSNCLRQEVVQEDLVGRAVMNERRFFRLEHNGLLALLELARDDARSVWQRGQLKGVANRTLTQVFETVAQRVVVTYNLLEGLGDTLVDWTNTLSNDGHGETLDGKSSAMSEEEA